MMNVYIRNGVLFSLCLALLMLTACKGPLTGERIEEPHIKIMIGNQELRGIYYGDRNNQTREEIEKRLRMAMEDKSLEQIPYIDLNEKIIIKTENFKTEEFKIFDYILTEDGCIRYPEKLVQTSVIPVKDGMAAFTLAPNPAALLSSSSVDYEPGKTMRGFVLRADIHGSPFAFAFVLRTDAHGENMFQPALMEETAYKTVNNLAGISLKTLKSVYPNNLNELGYVFHNRTDKAFTFGEEYYLEKFKDGKWYQLSIVPSEYDRSWPLIGYRLEPNSARNETLNLDWLYGTSFESGRYRIVKSIIHSENIGNYDEYYLTAEFNIAD